MDTSIKTIDDYINSCEKSVQPALQEIREKIKEVAPQVEEAIKYAMPSFVYKGNLVHFAAYKNHIGFYPGPSGIEAFADELKKYASSKGAVQFPLNKPLPMDLIGRIVKFRLEENQRKSNI